MRLVYRKPVNTFLPWLNFRAVERDAISWLEDDKYDIGYYHALDNETRKFLQYITQKTTVDDTILDIGCNQGRFLIGLSEHGYTDLHGVDIMRKAITILEAWAIRNDKNIVSSCASIQEFLPSLEDNSIDYCITFSATIELLHPNFDLFFELSRICRKGFIFAVNENGHTYPRFYRTLAVLNGFRKVSIFELRDDLYVLHYGKK